MATKIKSGRIADTLTGKDLTDSGNTFPTTLVTLAGTQTLTNKSIPYTINAQTGTTYTFALTDAGKLVTAGSASATTYTIPTNASVAFPTGTQIDVVQVGAGKVTFAPDTGVTLNSQSSNKAIAAQWVGVSLIKTDTNTWLLIGNLIA